MTREELQDIKAWMKVSPADSDQAHRLIDALEAAWTQLEAWESCGLTEEMLRDHDGYLRLSRGIVLVSEHYLEKLQAERDAYKFAAEQTIDQLKHRAALTDQVIKLGKFAADQLSGSGGSGVVASSVVALTAIEQTLAYTEALHGRVRELEKERDQVRQMVRQLESGEYICKKCGLRQNGEPPLGDF